jgi:hypothetical protein
MFAKIFAQIYDSSIVESPETRFTFMDFLVLSDQNGVVDMTHEAIARRTNRPLEVIRKTISELEGPDERSRSPEFKGARIKRLDDHRDWGWMIVNFNFFREIASEEQRRQKTLARVHKLRGKKKLENCNALKRSVTIGNDLPSASASVDSKEGENFVQTLKANPAYKGIDIDREMGRMNAWLSTPRGKGRKLTKIFVVNWLNKIDVPLGSRAIALKPPVDVPDLFKSWFVEEHEDRRDELENWKDFNRVPFVLRDEFLKWKKKRSTK